MIELTTDYLLDADKYEWRLVRHRGTFIDSKDGLEKPRYEVLGHYATIGQATTASLNIMLREEVATKTITDLSRLADAAEDFRTIIKEKLEAY